MPVFEQCGHRHRGDVLGMDEGLRSSPGRQCHLAGFHRREQELFAEVLHEEVRPDDRPLQAALLQRGFSDFHRGLEQEIAFQIAR
ncbi:MAG: hypothetical protein L0G87_00045 [Renibacterium salmoninarum]|nr:hypothetical protein [Renibacterium salmoninarum]